MIVFVILTIAAFIGGYLAACKSGEKEGICKYGNDKDGENDVSDRRS